MKRPLTILRILLVVCASLVSGTERNRADGAMFVSVTRAHGSHDSPIAPFSSRPPPPPP